MEVIIKNKTDKEQRAVVFGYTDSCFKFGGYEINGFINIKTDDGVEISFDGEIDSKKRQDIIENLRVIIIDSLEFSSNNRCSNPFMIFEGDANGDMSIKRVCHHNFLRPKADSIFPIIIPSTTLREISICTSLLFALHPYEEIKLKLNITKE